MLESTTALIEIAKSGAATPPIPRAAVECMAWCVGEIQRLRSALRHIADGDEVMRDGHTEMVAVADAEAIASEALTSAHQ